MRLRQASRNFQLIQIFNIRYRCKPLGTIHCCVIQDQTAGPPVTTLLKDWRLPKSSSRYLMPNGSDTAKEALQGLEHDSRMTQQDTSVGLGRFTRTIKKCKIKIDYLSSGFKIWGAVNFF